MEKYRCTICDKDVMNGEYVFIMSMPSSFKSDVDAFDEYQSVINIYHESCFLKQNPNFHHHLSSDESRDLITDDCGVAASDYAKAFCYAIEAFGDAITMNKARKFINKHSSDNKTNIEKLITIYLEERSKGLV